MYASFTDALRHEGFECHCPQLPTADLEYLGVDPANPDYDRDPPASGHPPQSHDSSILKTALNVLVEEQGKEVLLVAHSSGSWSAAEAATPLYQRGARLAEGKQGGIIGIFNIAGFLIEPGRSIWSTFSGQPNDAPKVDPAWTTTQRYELSIVNNPTFWLFHDLDPADVERLCKSLTACPYLTADLTNDAYAALPGGYLICMSDRVLPLEYQKAMITSTEGRTGKGMWVYRAPGGHASCFSCEKVCVESIFDFAARC
jgi:hypothetical protein